MGEKTAIEWCDATWNPVRGCTRITAGCGGPNHEGGCYAEKIAARFSGLGQPFHGFAERTPHGGRWTGKLALVENALDLPLRWKKPRRIFVNSMSDLFHENLPDAAIDRVFAVMALCPQHIFQVLTKRAARMRAYVSGLGDYHWLPQRLQDAGNFIPAPNHPGDETEPPEWPLPNVWLGVSVENQEEADRRIPALLDVPAARHFVSAEPLLGPIDFDNLREGTYDAITGCGDRERLWEWDGTPSLDWIIVGGESGNRARPFNLNWARSIREQSKAAGVAFFMKQVGDNPVGMRAAKHHGADPDEWPADLRVREFPDARPADPA